MKKIIIAAALVLTTGILASQTKFNNAQPTQVAIQKVSVSTDVKNLASAD